MLIQYSITKGVSVQFEWDEVKNESNLNKHGFYLEAGALVWRDAYRLVMADNRKDYGEDRFNCMGDTEFGVLRVCYTMRDDNIRLISVRRANKKERGVYNDNKKNDP
ncbi:MAG: BrnT family toxin [Rickettsiales bacterium]|jgi:uncharacterized DUF497 family protein|nr:BrnT family toxin [Rickettsiales bacterium]